MFLCDRARRFAAMTNPVRHAHFSVSLIYVLDCLCFGRFSLVKRSIRQGFSGVFPALLTLVFVV